MSSVIVLIFRILFALVIYAFLGWVILTIWHEIRLKSQLINVTRIPRISLSPVDFSEQNRQEFYDAEVVIGRDPSCDYYLPHDTVSARHALLSYHHNNWWIEDLDSTNGTTLNNERVNTPTVIISEDRLRCGKINLMITISPQR
ncbi:MAG: FHA domain-containing protein [Anaerolineaceae bacterium]|jgi:pSer/pThr/pTyr-binding forkhead associated (FHA) protein|nr:FHA domain-containing protein [Anaerolineaceae bacterium]